MKMEALWVYQQRDMEADRFETEMRQAPTRLKLLKERDFLQEQQNNMKRIEREVALMSDRLDALRDEEERLRGVLDNLLTAVKDITEDQTEEIDKQIAAASKLEDTLLTYEQEIAKMRKDSEARDRLQKDIRLRAASTKADFDEHKKAYDVEFKRDKAKLEELRKAAEEESKKVDPELLAKYRSIKQHIAPPIAKLNGNRCGGCNMELSAATLNAMNGRDFIECDNCGRALFKSEE